MDTLLIDGEEYVRIEPNKFVKRSTVKVEPEPVKVEPVKAEPVKAVEPTKAVEVTESKDEGWRLWRALPDLKDVSDEELKQHWDEMIKSKPKPKPLVGFLNSEKEVKTIVNTTEVYLSEQAFNFLETSEEGTSKCAFKASNGYLLFGGSKWTDEWTENSLYMSPKTFRGKRVNLTTLFSRSLGRITKESLSKFKIALTELAAAAAVPNPKVLKVVEDDLSNMESFGSTL